MRANALVCAALEAALFAFEASVHSLREPHPGQDGGALAINWILKRPVKTQKGMHLSLSHLRYYFTQPDDFGVQNIVRVTKFHIAHCNNLFNLSEHVKVQLLGAREELCV